MELIILVVIIAMVVGSMNKNAKEHKQRQEARRREGEAYAPKPVEPDAGPAPETKASGPFSGGMPEWLRRLEEMAGQGQAPAPTPARPTQPAPKPQPAQPIIRELRQGEASEGCLDDVWDGHAPHDQLHLPTQQQWHNPHEDEAEAFSFMQTLPEAAKGVIYAEILTRPKDRRRLRP